jgi:3-hydroxyisobutyrate dehydrogenase/2-hydroxy-3-oxopropionate reductase
MKEKIGFIGLGIMGRPMATHLLEAGYELHVYNRSKGSLDALAQREPSRKPAARGCGCQ